MCVSACILCVSHTSLCQHVGAISTTGPLTRVCTGLVRLYLGGDYVRRARLQEKLGPAYGVIMGMCTGQYDLDLTIATHRVALLRIQETCVFECSRRREALGFDTSQMACTQACTCKHARATHSKCTHTRTRAPVTFSCTTYMFLTPLPQLLSPYLAPREIGRITAIAVYMGSPSYWMQHFLTHFQMPED